MSEQKRADLIKVVRRLAAEHNSELEALREQAHSIAKRPDFLWHEFLVSFATMQGARGWKELMENPANYGKVTYDALSREPTSERRLQILLETLALCKVNIYRQKAYWLSSNYESIAAKGGLQAVQQHLLGLQGRDAKIAYLLQFEGIGDKYARNIMMDLYHDDFRQSIAIDARVKQVSRGLGVNISDYGKHEEYYLQVAGEAGLEGWELDRILWGFLPEVMQGLEVK